MIASLRHAWNNWRQTRSFLALSPDARSIVFYAEDAGSWAHLGPILQELTGPMQQDVCCLTSDPNDPILTHRAPRIHPFCIGDGSVRTWLFLNLQARVMVMTMPELETFPLQRSKTHPVHYVYVFHSMVSTHMIYRKGAFDHFDTVLCVGPHHLQEIRAREASERLKPKRLIPHGFGRLDALIQEQDRRAGISKPAAGGSRRMLIAPSWGPQALLESHGKELVQVLLKAGYHVTVRPHPMTRKKHPELMRALATLLKRHTGCVLETDVASQESLHGSDLLISDWSGAALEYAFALERPVLFVDVPKKVNNPDYPEVPYPPLEVTVRSEIGCVVDPRDLNSIPAWIETLCADPSRFRSRIRTLRERTVFNVGASARAGAGEIARLAG